MTYRLPVYNLPVAIWTSGSGPPSLPRLTTMGNLTPGRRQFQGRSGPAGSNTAIPGAYLLLPSHTDIRGQNSPTGSDLVNVPTGSNRFYECMWAEDAGKGFSNEHRIAALSQNNPFYLDGGPTPPPPASGLHQWLFNEGTGTVAHDTGSAPNDITVLSGTWVSTGPPAGWTIAKSLANTSSTSDHYDTHASYDTIFNAAVTMGGWINASSLSPDGIIFGSSAIGGMGWTIGFAGTGLPGVAALGTTPQVGTGPISTGWNFVCFTYDQVNIRHYLGGAPNGTPAYSGTFGGGGGYSFGGSIASLGFLCEYNDMRIYDHVLSPAQIATWFTTGVV